MRIEYQLLICLVVVVGLAWTISSQLEQVGQNICKGSNEYISWGRKDCT